MKRNWLLLLAVVALLFCARAHAATCTAISPGANIQAAMNSCGSGNTLPFNSGTFPVSSTLTIPCGLSMTGPAIPYPGPPPFSTPPFQATFSSSVTNGAMFNWPSSCTTPMTVSNFNFNGNQPSGGGGGGIYFPTSGGSNVTITNNYFLGNWASITTAHQFDSFLWFDGNEGGNTWTNVTVSWNGFGASTDCNPIMGLFTYQGSAYSSAGGFCTAISMHSNMANMSIHNNAIYHQEQGMKGFEGGSTVATVYNVTGNVTQNDFGFIHRIGYEAQVSPLPVNVASNSMHDLVMPGYGSFGFSFASLPLFNPSNNVMVDNVTCFMSSQNNCSQWIPAAIEFWGQGTQSNNLIQGFWGGGTVYATYPWNGSSGGSIITNNTYQLIHPGAAAISNEFPTSGNPAPTISGNVTGTSVSAVTSVAPTISPAAGTQSFPLTVTLTDPGYTSGAVPQGNTGIWYTTDGSAPVPRSGTAKYALSGSTITLGAAGTVKAVGMWGAANQPASYPSGYGFTPSAPVSAAYTGGGAPTCSSLSAGASVATINAALSSCAAAGGGTVFLGAGTYSINGTITIPCKVSLSGPVVTYSQTHYQTAIFSGSVTQPIQTTAACGGSPPYQHLSYIEWNGNHQNNGGGGVNIVAGTNGFVVDHNFMHGAFTTSYYDGGTGMAQVLLSGGGGTINNPTQNVQVTLNEFGPETNTGASGDCGSAMAAADTEASQGLCVGILNDTFSKNVSWDHNIFHNLEQGAKVVEVTTNQGQTTNSGNTQNLTVSYNWFYGIHRIDFETQSNYYTAAFPSSQTINYNLLGDRDFTANTDPTVPFQGGNGQYNYDLSIANGCVNNLSLQPYCSANIDFNADVQALSTSHGSGNEIWGDANTHGNFGLFQGYVAFGGGAYQWSDQGNFQFNNNTFNIYSGAGKSTACNPGNGGYWNNEISGNHPVGTPTCTGNTYSSAGTGTTTSAAPTISPASGSFSGTQTVTLTNTGTNRDTNTSIWYTTDGSNPVPGTAKLYTGPFTVVSPATVKAVGMWGAINQPYSYTASYGYVPSAVQTATYTAGGQYYISPTGLDSNSGTSPGSPWLSPNHAVNCGDTITAASGNYSSANFYNGKWGTVSCPANNNVAWLQCATFDTCKIAATSQQGMYVSSSYWGISGWEITDSWTFGNCYYVQPTGSTPVHHVIFANDVATGCAGGGFVAFANTSTPAVDYIALIGDIAYGTGSSSSVCASGFSLGFLPQLDSTAGTHLYIAGSFGWGNVNPSSCASTLATDGEGIIIDTLKQFGYNQQVAIENNIMVGNFGRGIEVNNNNTASPATAILKNNTSYGNNLQAGQQFPSNNGELYVNQAFNVQESGNLAMPSQGTTGGQPIYASSVNGSNSSTVVQGNMFFSAFGNTTLAVSSGSFAFGSNTTTTNPAFANPVIPGAPSCSGTANVPACAAALVNNFKPTATGSSAFGYQTPSSTSVTDPLYPQWLCNVALPAGLVTPGCGGGTTPTLVSGVQGNTGSVNTLAVGASPVQQSAIGTYSDGNTRTLPDAFGNTAVWSSSNSTILSVSSTGSIACLTTGTANSRVSSSPTGIVFSVWTWTCTSGGNPTLTGGALGNTGSINTQVIGNTAIQFVATGTYSDGVNRTLPDSFGNTATWSSSNGTILSVGSTGLVNCLTSGSADVVVVSGSVNFNHWTMTCSNPTQSGGFLSNPGSVNTIAVGGGTIAFSASVTYSNSPATNALPDAFGNSVTSWSVVPGSSTCGTMSSNTFTPTTAGTCNVRATCTACLVQPSQWTMTVSASATISSVSLSTAGGVTGLIVGSTNQLKATCHYSDGSTTDCTTTDSHGNIAGSWTSSNTGHATVSGSGLVTGVAQGTTNLTAAAGGHTSPALPLMVLPNGTYTITVTGPVRFSGRVSF